MLFAEGQLHDACLQVAVRRPCSALAAIGAKLLDGNTQRDAGIAPIAIRAIRKHAAAAKTISHQSGVNICIDQVAGRSHL